MSHKDLKDIPHMQRAFSKTVSDTDLWMAPSKTKLVDGLLATVEARQWASLVGDPGVGKTCVMRSLRHRLSGREGYRLTYCHNTTLGRRDFYRQICTALNLSPKATAAGVFHEITSHVTELAREQIQSILVVDEAHLLRPEILDHLHILGNYEWDSAPLLTIILVGLPELEEQLALRRNRSLYSRISRRFRISPLKPEDTLQYLRARLEIIGYQHEVFSMDAAALIHEAGGGTLRDLDRLATNAIRHAAHLGSRLVERDAVTLAIRDDRICTG